MPAVYYYAPNTKYIDYGGSDAEPKFPEYSLVFFELHILIVVSCDTAYSVFVLLVVSLYLEIFR